EPSNRRLLLRRRSRPNSHDYSIMPCDCPFSDSKRKVLCPRHGVEKSPHWRALCAQGGGDWEAWEAGEGPGQHKRMASGSSAKDLTACVHRSAEPIGSVECVVCSGTGEKKAIEVFRCGLFNCEVTRRRTEHELRACVRCDKRVSPES